MRKKSLFFVEDFLPDSEKEALAKIIQEAEEQERKEQEDNDEFIHTNTKPDKQTQEPDADDEPQEKEETQKRIGNSDVLKDKMTKYLRDQFKDLREGLSLIAEEFDAESINACIDSLQYDEPSWEKLLILEAWGDKE